MKILEVSHLLPDKFGSFEKYSLGFGVFLRKKGHQHHSVYLSTPCAVLDKEIKQVGGSVSIMDYNNLGVMASLQLLRYIRKHDIDVVHFHFYPVYSFFTLISKFIASKVFFSYRISGDFSDNSIAVRMLKKLRSNILGIGISGVFCVSDYTRRQFINNFQANPDKAFVVHNGLNWDYFPVHQNVVNEVVDGGLRVICVAAMIQEKGIDDLLAAVLELKDSIPCIHLSLIGSGGDRGKFAAFVKNKNMEEHVTFLGSRNDVPALLGGFDVAVIPSRWAEAFGFTVIEAMAASLPVIATAVGGIPEIIEHKKTGLLVQKEKPDEIAEALLRLYRNKKLRVDLGLNARRRVKKYFNVNRVYEQQLNYYLDLKK